MAITQALHEIDKGAEWIAVLDMKSAYDRVQRDRLQQLCDDVLPHQLSAMVSHLLQPLKVETGGDIERKEGVITRGVTQGGPASTKLFNIYINPLAEKLAIALCSPRCRSPAKLYADDVILLLQAYWQLIVALRICEEWGTLYGMEWAVEPGKSQLLLSKQHAKVVPSIAFAGAVIRSVTTAKCLGVILTSQGVSEQSSCLRIRNAHATLTNLRKAQLLTTGTNPKFALTIFRSLLQSQIDYASFLSPCTAEACVAYSGLLSRFFGIVLGVRLKKSQLGKVRLLFQIPSQLLRRKILANQFLDRMKNAANGESERRKTTQAKLTLEAVPCTTAHDLQMAGGVAPRDLMLLELGAAQTQRRSVPIVTSGGLPPALLLQSYQLRRAAVRWHLGTFPRNFPLLRRIGLQRVLSHLELLQNPCPTQPQWREIRMALRILTAIPEDLLL